MGKDGKAGWRQGEKKKVIEEGKEEGRKGVR